MGLFSRKSKPQQSSYRPIPSNARTEREWQQWEARRGCSSCGKTGCNRTNHSYTICGGCGSAYCNGDACPGRGRGR